MVNWFFRTWFTNFTTAINSLRSHDRKSKKCVSWERLMNYLRLRRFSSIAQWILKTLRFSRIIPEPSPCKSPWKRLEGLSSTHRLSWRPLDTGIVILCTLRSSSLPGRSWRGKTNSKHSVTFLQMQIGSGFVGKQHVFRIEWHLGYNMTSVLLWSPQFPKSHCLCWCSQMLPITISVQEIISLSNSSGENFLDFGIKKPKISFEFFVF